MPLIHVARDGAKLGEFTLEQIREGLSTGQFRGTDLAWQSGMTDWRPLSEVVGATTAAAPVLATPAIPATGLPWENRKEIGMFKAWFDTVSMLISKPGEAFTIMRPEGGLTDPLIFGMIGGCAGTLVSIVFQVLFRSIPGFNSGSDTFDLFGLGPWTLFIIYAALHARLVFHWQRNFASVPDARRGREPLLRNNFARSLFHGRLRQFVFDGSNMWRLHRGHLPDRAGMHRPEPGPSNHHRQSGHGRFSAGNCLLRRYPSSGNARSVRHALEQTLGAQPALFRDDAFSLATNSAG
jgi:hypothetical protein